MSELLFLLLPVAAASGWWLAYRSSSKASRYDKNFCTDNYLAGINYLLNEQPDKAVDTFIKMLEVDSETVEMHLALGVLFCRRGEIDRAIRIHQNLIARPALSRQQRIQALLALGCDYYRAGVLDRAERFFLEVIEASSEREHRLAASHYLLEIYQQQKRWETAIITAKKIRSQNRAVIKKIAHYYCELATEFLRVNQLDQAQIAIKRALATDAACARASLLQGNLAFKLGQFAAAIEAYERVSLQDADYISETIFPLVCCYDSSGINKEKLLEHLSNLLSSYPRASTLLTLVDLIQKESGCEAARHFLVQQLQRQPLLRGLQRLVSLQLNSVQDKAREHFVLLEKLIGDLLKTKFIYRCTHCGFGSKILHWLCPGCRSWSTVKPVQGIEGE